MPELTADLIADISNPNGLCISPDGRYVAYTLSPSGKKEEHPISTIWIASTDGLRPTRQFTSGEFADRNPQWSPDGTQLAFLSDRAKRGTAQLYLIAIDGGEARPLMSKEHKKAVQNFAWSPGGGQIAFTSADEPTEEDERREKERDDARVYGERLPHARLRLLSLATREVTTLVSGDRHIAEFAWHPQGTELAYVVWQTPELESLAYETFVERISLAGGEPQIICRFPSAVSSLTWSPDGETLLFGASVTGKAQSSRAIYAVSAQGGEPHRIACGETNCAGKLYQPYQSQVTTQARQVAMLLGEGLESRVCWLDPITGSLSPLSPTSQEDLTKDIADWSVRVVEEGRTVLAVVRGAAHEPWEVWAGFADGPQQVSTLQQVSSHQEAFAGLTFGPQEPFYWTAPDGLALDGILVRPPDAPTDQPLPTIVLVHGGPYWRWGQGFHLSWGNWAQWLALAGYAILMPNPRGGLGHGEQFAAAARGDVGGADYADVMAAVDAAIERGISDPDHLGIGGWSQGGYMTAWAVTQTDRFKAAVMGAGVSDWGMMTLTSDLPDFELELGGTAPWDGLGNNQHLKSSPITFASHAKTPVLILHGENDARVPLSQATGFHRALRKHHVPTEFVVYPREPHGIGERAHQIDLLNRVRSWYDRWLRS
ncbi:MAG TPA: S9 family peptidase [Ktedonobacteraceae bacterium]|nr:S9 family peptidase [Ktedonobacteraceae bacterium]